MFQRILAATLLACSNAAVFAQPPNLLPSFEVASVKPVPLSDMNSLRVTMQGGPGTSDPGQITYSNVSLRQTLVEAYDVKDFQISGPGWLATKRFDIMARIPPGATKAQFRLMLQNLLAERFRISLHHETKDLPIYALLVGKNGHKLQESLDNPLFDGAAKVSPGTLRTTTSLNGGRTRIQASCQTITALANVLSNRLSLPVVDETGLQGKYDFTLEFVPELGVRAGPVGLMPMANSPANGPAYGDNDGPNLTTAVQRQLGLKLEARKGPVDVLVIDHAATIPTEN